MSYSFVKNRGGFHLTPDIWFATNHYNNPIMMITWLKYSITIIINIK